MFYCYECDAQTEDLVWKSRCVSCVVKKLKANLNENEELRERLAVAESKIPKWIPVGESMPAIAEPYVEYGEWVLGKERYCKVPIICCRTWIDKEQNYWEWTAENGVVIDVTHWMPLPEVSESGSEVE